MQYPGHVIELNSPDGIAVQAIKVRLKALGFGKDLEGTPAFGAKTKTAVETFQRSKLLLADGRVGSLTWSKLFDEPAVAPSPRVQSQELAIRATEIARQYVGVREKTGKNDGEEVKAFLGSVGLTEGFAWCAAFVYFIFQKAASQLQQQNPLPRTGGVLKMWNDSPASARIEKGKGEPRVGDIMILSYGKGQGHTGIIIKVTATDIVTIEGNTNDASSREGDGVYVRTRSRSSSLFIGCLRF